MKGNCASLGFFFFSSFCFRLVETLRQLILSDLEDGWSQDSDDTPTNETANERSPFTDHPGSQMSEPSFRFSESPRQAMHDHSDAPPTEAEQPTVQVMRKGEQLCGGVFIY